MEKVITISTATQKQATEIAHALKQLDSDGRVTLGTIVIVHKDPEGNLILHDSVRNAPESTLTGTLVGGLIGLLGGLPGLLVGMAGGSLVGAASDAARYDLSEDYIKQVGQTMPPDSSALIAHVWEDSPTDLDAVVMQHGGTINRSLLSPEADERLAQEIDAADAEIAELETRLNQTDPDMRPNVQHRIGELKERKRELQDKIEGSFEARKQLHRSRIERLQERSEQERELESDIARHRQRLASLEARLQALQNKPGLPQ